MSSSDRPDVTPISPEALDELDAAVRKYAATEGDYVTGWVMVAAAAPDDDPNAVAYHFGESAHPPHALVGLHMAGLWRMEKIMKGEGGEPDDA
jgi:hypothetical protein